MPARRVVSQPTSAVAAAAASASASAPVPFIHPTIRKLRQSWKFAALCQFLLVFDEAFGMDGFETDALERDFEGTESSVIPDLMQRMLYTLTLDKAIDTSNWLHHLRTQYLRRDPEKNKLGTIDEPVDWHRLELDDKITALHDLCEWQLTDPERFRKLVKNELDTTTWRVSPIGWDSQDNAYWLFDDNRIWIQRPEPLPAPKPKARAPPKKGSKRARMEAAAARRAAKAEAEAQAEQPATPASRKRGRVSEPASRTPSKRSKTTETSTPSRPPPRRGTRSSARFSTTEQDDSNWEQIPSDLQNRRDSDSDLSDPPEDDDAGDEKAAVADASMDIEDASHQNGQEIEPKVEDEEQEKGEEEEKEEWIEFEAIVVTRADWEAFAQRFAKSKDPNEKNLHQFVNKELLPMVMANFDEIDKQRALEAAMANRKRSSRIAMKESEKEERERDRLARARMEEKMAKLREEEAAAIRKQEEEEQAQMAREMRMREREERLLAREREIEERAIKEEQERERREREREERKRRRDEIIANGGVPPPETATATPEPADHSASAPAAQEEEENWELGCEVCGKAGINPPDEGKEIVACETCGVWQHVKCWNKFDKHILGRKKNRDWENEDFYCTKCRPPPEGVPRPTPGMVFKRAAPSPSAKSDGQRPSQDPETPTKSQTGPGLSTVTPGTSPTRPKIKLVHHSPLKDGSETVPAPVGPGASAVLTTAAASPSGGQPAETGVLTTTGTARPVSAPTPDPAAALPQVSPVPTTTAVPASQLPSAKPVPVPTEPHASPIIPATQGTPSTAAAPLVRSEEAAKPSSNAGNAERPPLPTPVPAVPAEPQVPRPATESMPPPTPRAVPSQPVAVASSSPASTAVAAISRNGDSSSPEPSKLNGQAPQSPLASSSGSSVSRSPSYGGSPGMRRPSGSFPIRHLPTRSPLSKPYESSDLATPPPLSSGAGLGPSRAKSPTPTNGAAGRPANVLTKGPSSPFGSVPSSRAVPASPVSASTPVGPRVERNGSPAAAKQFGPSPPKAPFGVPYPANATLGQSATITDHPLTKQSAADTAPSAAASTPVFPVQQGQSQSQPQSQPPEQQQ